MLPPLLLPLHILLILSVFLSVHSYGFFPDYVPCPSSSSSSSSSPDPRRFYLSTFLTGNNTLGDEKFFLEGQSFNTSWGKKTDMKGEEEGGYEVKEYGLQDVRIVGKELNFWNGRFYNHPLSSLAYVRYAIKREEALGRDPHSAYSMHVDYDSVLTGTSMERLWEKFDCARNGKPILIAGETGCLAGLGCTTKQLKKYYTPIGKYRSAFLNAGGIMGSLPALEKMFSHIVDNYQMYRKLTWRLKWFCDQNALAHWRANGTNHEMVELDHQQEVFGTIPFQTPNHKQRRANDGVCRNDTGEIIHKCIIVVPVLSSFEVNPKTCSVLRNKDTAARINPMISSFLSEVSPDPAMLHGMGGGPSKGVYRHLTEEVYKCRRRQAKVYAGGNM